MMFKSVCIFILYLLISLTGSVIADEEAMPSLTIYTIENSPFSYRDEKTGEQKGIATDILRTLMKNTGTSYELKLSDLPFKRLLRTVRSTANSCLYVLNRMPSREDQFLWVGPLMVGGWAIFKLPDTEIKISSFDELKRYSVTGLQFTAPVIALKNAGIPVIEMARNSQSLDLIYSKRAQLLVGGLIDVPMRVAEQNKPALEMVYHWKKADLSMGCSRSTDPRLIESLNAENSSMGAFRDQVLKQYISEMKP
jgi:polar amino acid transport system substrate-binding protein